MLGAMSALREVTYPYSGRATPGSARCTSTRADTTLPQTEGRAQ